MIVSLRQRKTETAGVRSKMENELHGMHQMLNIPDLRVSPAV
jgi:hypothetical protein